MTIAEQIYALVKVLPPEQASEVLNFAEFIQAKHLKAEPSSESTPWAELVHSLAGAWRDDFPTLEEIRADSEQDISREIL